MVETMIHQYQPLFPEIQELSRVVHKWKWKVDNKFDLKVDKWFNNFMWLKFFLPIQIVLASNKSFYNQAPALWKTLPNYSSA